MACTKLYLSNGMILASRETFTNSVHNVIKIDERVVIVQKALLSDPLLLLSCQLYQFHNFDRKMAGLLGLHFDFLVNNVSITEKTGLRPETSMCSYGLAILDIKVGLHVLGQIKNSFVSSKALKSQRVGR